MFVRPCSWTCRFTSLYSSRAGLEKVSYCRHSNGQKRLLPECLIRRVLGSVGRTLDRGKPLSTVPNRYLTGANNGQQTIRTSFDGKRMTLPFSENISRRPRSEKILQSTEDQNYKRGILFPISYFEKKEREISHLHRPLRVPAEGRTTTQHNTTQLQHLARHSTVVIKGDHGNS